MENAVTSTTSCKDSFSISHFLCVHTMAQPYQGFWVSNGSTNGAGCLRGLLRQAYNLDILKKTQGGKNSKLKKKTQ